MKRYLLVRTADTTSLNWREGAHLALQAALKEWGAWKQTEKDAGITYLCLLWEPIKQEERTIQ